MKTTRFGRAVRKLLNKAKSGKLKPVNALRYAVARARKQGIRFSVSVYPRDGEKKPTRNEVALDMLKMFDAMDSAVAGPGALENCD